MALTSDSQSSADGAKVIEQESAAAFSGDDLEDGEIFEDETTAAPASAPKTEKEIIAETILSNIRNSKPLLPTPKSFDEADKLSKDNSFDINNKKRRKRQSRDEEEEHCDEKKKKKENKKSYPDQDRKRELLEKLEAEFAMNDDDLIYARGASPLRHDDDFDRWEDEEDDDDHRRHNPRNRGMGRRDHIGRGKRRGGRGGSGIPRKRKRDDHDNICIFYMQGKCHRGNDCPYSHDSHPPRKLELCKFYMMDCCAKKDKCLYMHNDFPCKYYHTGLKCYAGKNCKFSHGKLNETLRTVLLKRFCPQHLETAPKDILGEFPRMSREGAMTIMHGRNDKKIPSLFDIKVPKPANLCNNSNSDGSHTPMPSPTHHLHDSKSSDRENTPDKEERKERRSKERHDRRKDKKKERKREQRKERDKHKESKERSKEKHHLEEDKNVKIPAIDEGEEEAVKDKGKEKEKEIESEVDPVALVIDENPESVPAHLPKKQRELFLRIQQQQREANSGQASGDEDDHDEGDMKTEDNWYSSDEESPPPSTLPTILRNLTQSSTTPVTSTAKAPTLTESTTLVQPIIPNIDFTKFFQVLSSLKMDQKTETPVSSSSENVENDQTPTNTNEDAATTKQVDIFSILKSELNLDKANITTASSPKSQELPRARDPRLRNDIGAAGDHPQPSASTGDIDLRIKTNSPRNIGAGDIDLRNLPFKPAPHHSAANEIDASLSSHSPIIFRLIPVEVSKTDYASLQALAKPGVNDPRLRRALRVSTDDTSIRDPRQRLGLIDDIRPKVPPSASLDPRQRVNPFTQNIAPTLPTPTTPRYDEDHRQSFYRGVDSDMRQFPPPTPRSDDDFGQNLSRIDPRQRNFDSDPRRLYHSARQHLAHSFDTDLRPQLGLQQSQYNLK